MLNEPARLRIPIGAPLSGEGSLEIAIDVFAPAHVANPPAVLFCMPGGGMSRRYFDLPGEGMSFARAMAAQGFVVVTMDHVGVGESTRPNDGFAITSAVAADANAAALEEISRRLRDGVLDPRIPALLRFTPIGVGHSMGALILALQQDKRRDFSALMMLGFGTCGMPEVLSDEDRAALELPDRGLSKLPRLAARRFVGYAYPPIPRAPGNSAASKALEASADIVLAVPAVHSMMPGNIKDEIARLDVPIFLAAGDRDVVGPPRLLPAEYASAADITLIVIEKCGHHPFVSVDTPRFMARAEEWIRAQTK
jgi:pimeloyl-ACP methyl ester carboxylesterase